MVTSQRRRSALAELTTATATSLPTSARAERRFNELGGVGIPLLSSGDRRVQGWMRLAAAKDFPTAA
jgi:hypothetical protein